MPLGVPIGTCVPYRHAVCRSHKLIYQGDKAGTARFATRKDVPICAAVGVVQNRHRSVRNWLAPRHSP